MEKMSTTIACTAGIDISKQHLDAHIHPSNAAKRFCNSKSGWRALATWFASFNPQRIVYEATGPYHRAMEQALAARALPLVRVNPRRARRFAEVLGTSAKTDRVDARMLALYGAMLAPGLTAISSQILEELRELEAARQALLKVQTAQINRSKSLASALLKRQTRAILKLIKTQIEAIDRASAKIIEAEPSLRHRFAILMSIPSVGAITARAMIVLMPELGNLDEKQVASLAGLAPFARDSGQWRGKRFCQGGRARLRNALYMPALVACRFNPQLNAWYNNLVNAGKPKNVAITAVMRKLIIIANALIRDNRMWQNQTA